MEDMFTQRSMHVNSSRVKVLVKNKLVIHARLKSRSKNEKRGDLRHFSLRKLQTSDQQNEQPEAQQHPKECWGMFLQRITRTCPDCGVSAEVWSMNRAKI